MKHRDVVELLPWYANETLEEREREAVEAHLEGCASCDRELSEVKALRGALLELDEAPPEPSPALLNRALAEIDRYERERQRPIRSIERMKDLLFGWWQPLPAFARVTVAAQFVLLVGMAGLLLKQRDAESEFRTASQPTDASRARRGLRLLLGFQPGISEEAMRRVILELHGEIVSGPSPLGLYTVEVPIARDRRGEAEKLLQRLRENLQVIRFAEQWQ